MAMYWLKVNPISRSAGRSAPAAAAYRAGERIRDERTGLLHNYSRRRDVTHSEIFLPNALAATDVPWARDRALLWNCAEAAEHRGNSRVACEYQIALPHQLSAAQRQEVARGFSRELSERHQVVVDLAIHEPRAAGDPRNHHAHLLASTRELSAEGFGAKAGLDMPYRERIRRGLLPGIRELVAIRERWAILVNEAFLAAGLNERVDHRSLAAQGIDREPMPAIPFAAYQMERRGLRSEVAERLRERYRERVAARAMRQNATQAADPGLHTPASTPGACGIEELRRSSREAWLKLRRETAHAGASPAVATKDRQSVLQQAPEQSRAADELTKGPGVKDFCL
jgi:MobA/MobL family